LTSTRGSGQLVVFSHDISGPLANIAALPMDAFDQLRAAALADRAQFFKDLSAPSYGANRAGAKVSRGLRDSFWLRGMLAGHNAAYDSGRISLAGRESFGIVRTSRVVFPQNI
jgi:hypothetical protein